LKNLTEQKKTQKGQTRGIMCTLKHKSGEGEKSGDGGFGRAKNSLEKKLVDPSGKRLDANGEGSNRTPPVSSGM